MDHPQLILVATDYIPSNDELVLIVRPCIAQYIIMQPTFVLVIRLLVMCDSRIVGMSNGYGYRLTTIPWRKIQNPWYWDNSITPGQRYRNLRYLRN